MSIHHCYRTAEFKADLLSSNSTQANMGLPTDEREVLTTISPTTNQPIVTRHGLNSAELNALGHRAREAQARLRKLSLSQRQGIVAKALASLPDSRDVLGQDLTKQMGRPTAYTPGEIDTAVKRGEYCLRISSDAMSDTPGDEQRGFRRYIRKEPVGVVLIVFAWNASGSILREPETIVLTEGR